jgi:hypothetical protein
MDWLTHQYPREKLVKLYYSVNNAGQTPNDYAKSKKHVYGFYLK